MKFLDYLDALNIQLVIEYIPNNSPERKWFASLKSDYNNSGGKAVHIAIDSKGNCTTSLMHSGTTAISAINALIKGMESKQILVRQSDPDSKIMYTVPQELLIHAGELLD
jgi:hypothetical protein